MACIDYGTLEGMYDCLIDAEYSNGEAVTHLLNNVDSSELLPSGFALNEATNGIKYTDQSCVISQMSVLPIDLSSCYDNYTMDDFFATDLYQDFIDGVEIGGCTDSSAMNYEPYSDYDDGSCNYTETNGGEDVVCGCTNPHATNYNPDADGNCEYIADPCIFTEEDNCPVCTDPEANNYNVCEGGYGNDGCTYDDADTTTDADTDINKYLMYGGITVVAALGVYMALTKK